MEEGIVEGALDRDPPLTEEESALLNVLRGDRLSLEQFVVAGRQKPIRVTALSHALRQITRSALELLRWVGKEEFEVVFSRTTEMIRLLARDEGVRVGQLACSCTRPELVLLVKDAVSETDWEALRQKKPLCATAEALQWLYPEGRRLSARKAARILLYGQSEAPVRWVLRYCITGPLDQKVEEALPSDYLELADRCMCDRDRARWVLRERPDFRDQLTAERLLFGVIGYPMRRLDAVRVLREFDYAVTEEMKQKCFREELREHLCALLSCGFLSSVPPLLDRMSCRDAWFLWTPLTHGLIKDFEITRRVITALCCFRIFCPQMPKDLKGLILTTAMNE